MKVHTNLLRKNCHGIFRVGLCCTSRSYFSVCHKFSFSSSSSSLAASSQQSPLLHDINSNNTVNANRQQQQQQQQKQHYQQHSNPLPRLRQIRDGLHYDWRSEVKHTPLLNDISPAMPDANRTEEHRRKVAGWQPVVRVLADQRLRVALVGRMNCGKSYVFNLICHDPTLPQRVNVVKDFDGITRDSIESHGVLGNMHLTIIDTPGMVHGKVVEEAFRTVQTADVALFITSPDVELNHEQHDLVRYLAIKKLPTLLIVNKMDLVPVTEQAHVLDSYKTLGIGNPLPFSARRRDGLDSLAAAIEPLYHIHAMRKVENDWDLQDSAMNGDEAAMEQIRDRNCTDKFIRVAIVGRANSGKTSLLNRLVGFERSRASSQRHTTRDAMQIACMYKGRKLKLIDTAGITPVHSRAQRDFINHIHKLSMQQVRFAHVVIVVFDATEGHPSKFDMSVLHKVAQQGRPFLLCANKWDAVLDQSASAQAIDFKIKRQVREVKYTNAVVVSAQTGLNLTLLMDQILLLYDTWNRRVRGAELTRFWRKLQKAVIIPHHVARVGRISQVNIRPPTFLLNLQTKDDEKLLPIALQSMMKNALVQEFGFQGVPIRLIQRVKDSNPDYI